jgi:hypothetical protein
MRGGGVVYIGRSKLVCLSFVSVELMGVWILSGAVEVLYFDIFRPLKSLGGGGPTVVTLAH